MIKYPDNLGEVHPSWEDSSQSAFTCSKSKIETAQKGVNYVQS